VGKRSSTEPVYKDFKDGRISIPNNFCDAAGLRDEGEPLDVTFWMVKKGRYRVLSGDNAKHPEIESLRLRISGRRGPESAVDFGDEPAAVLNYRLVDEVNLGSGKERRLSVPDPIQDILKLRKEGRGVVVLDGHFIEIWSVELFESTLDVLTSDL
jgi:DNA-binding transcriptional regulator/RsmH inhibitor MraZ